MKSVEDIESALSKLSVPELEAVREWLDDFLEDQLEVTEEFRNKVLAGKRDIELGIDLRRRKASTAKQRAQKPLLLQSPRLHLELPEQRLERDEDFVPLVLQTTQAPFVQFAKGSDARST